MFEKTIEAITPFALTFIVFAGATLAGWATFTNPRVIGMVVVAFGILLIVAHVAKQVTTNKNDK